MNETTQKINTLSLFVCDSIFVSEDVIVGILIVRIATRGYPSFNAKEIAELREVLRISIGSSADRITEENLSEFGATMLHATAIVLKAKHLHREAPFEVQ